MLRPKSVRFPSLLSLQMIDFKDYVAALEIYASTLETEIYRLGDEIHHLSTEPSLEDATWFNTYGRISE